MGPGCSQPGSLQGVVSRSLTGSPSPVSSVLLLAELLGSPTQRVCSPQHRGAIVWTPLLSSATLDKLLNLSVSEVPLCQPREKKQSPRVDDDLGKDIWKRNRYRPGTKMLDARVRDQKAWFSYLVTVSSLYPSHSPGKATSPPPCSALPVLLSFPPCPPFLLSRLLSNSLYSQK